MTRTPYAQFARNVLCGLAAVVALGSVQIAHAGYAQVTPPAGWAAGGGAGGSFVGTKAANTATFLSGNVTTNASLNVGGRAVPMPATMRFAANAPRIAASAVMLHPGIRTAAAVAGWLGLAGLFWDEASGLWKAPSDPASSSLYLSDGYQYRAFTSPYGPWRQTKAQACQDFAVSKGGTFAGIASDTGNCLTKYPSGSIGSTPGVQRGSFTDCPSGWYVTPAGCVQTPPPKTVTQEEAIEELTKHPMPAEVPKHIPDPLPVELPEWQPMFIPTGNPVPNPSYNPNQAPSPTNQPYVQPGQKVSPAPSPSAPWQADVVPVYRPTPSPTGSTDPSTEPSTNPTHATPRDDGKEDRDFCDKHPKALACLELDEPEEVDLPKSTFNVTYAIENNWGNGSCPADVYATVGGKTLKVYDWVQTCDYVSTYIRPILLALCAFGALMILIPSRND